MRIKLVLLLIVLIVIAVVAAAFVAGWQELGESRGQKSNASSQEVLPTVGVTFSPATYDSQGYQDFVSKAKQTGGLLGWYGDWLELSNPTSGAYSIAALAAENGLAIVPIVTYYQQGARQELWPLTEANRAKYLDGLEAFVREFSPQWLGIGIEVNVWFEHDAAGFGEFVVLFNEAYDRIKSVSPSTQVFTVFQLERLRGLKGGLFAPRDNNGTVDWALLEQFDRADMLAFTSYPGLIYQSPQAIPADYYAVIREYTDKPLAFTEIGWHHNDFGAEAWASSDAEEAEFIERFFALTNPMEPELRLWSFLYDQEVEGNPVLSHMGLLEAGQATSLSWKAWVGEIGGLAGWRIGI